MDKEIEKKLDKVKLTVRDFINPNIVVVRLSDIKEIFKDYKQNIRKSI